MSKVKHTPGPWRVYNVQTDPFARIGTYRHAICTIAPSGNVYADAANARLIAAAPEMLEALRAAHKWLLICDDTRSDDDLKKVEAALRHAEGQQ